MRLGALLRGSTRCGPRVMLDLGWQLGVEPGFNGIGLASPWQSSAVIAAKNCSGRSTDVGTAVTRFLPFRIKTACRRCVGHPQKDDGDEPVAATLTEGEVGARRSPDSPFMSPVKRTIRSSRNAIHECSSPSAVILGGLARVRRAFGHCGRLFPRFSDSCSGYSACEATVP